MEPFILHFSCAPEIASFIFTLGFPQAPMWMLGIGQTPYTAWKLPVKGAQRIQRTKEKQIALNSFPFKDPKPFTKN